MSIYSLHNSQCQKADFSTVFLSNTAAMTTVGVDAIADYSTDKRTHRNIVDVKTIRELSGDDDDEDEQ